LNRLREAMGAHPDMIAGDGNLDTDLMRLTWGKFVAKLGAEGVLCIGVPGRGLGIAIVMDDGSTRGQGPATVAVLEQLELADAQTLAKIRE
jgi:L-asparaginase